MSVQSTEAETAGTAGAGRTSPSRLRSLYWFWAIVLTGLGGGGAALQVLGPPSAPRGLQRQAAAPHAAGPIRIGPDIPGKMAGVAPPTTAAIADAGPASSRTAEAVSRHAAGAAITPPDDALLTASAQFPDRRLPRIAEDGRTPMQVYAGGFDVSDTRPRVALLLAGIGQSDIYSDDASRLLPAGVTFAVSPYANQPGRLLEDMRARGHEFLLSLPMEPQGSPVNDAGPQSLLTGATPAQNTQRLEWALTRFAGYVGVTSALDGLRGERFSASSTQMNQVLDVLASRGLMYVDAGPAAGRTVPINLARLPSRTVDVVIDEPAVRTEIEQKLQRLEQIARDRGSAVGLAGLPRPVTIDRIAAWSAALASHGIALAPMSVLATQPDPARLAGEPDPTLPRQVRFR